MKTKAESFAFAALGIAICIGLAVEGGRLVNRYVEEERGYARGEVIAWQLEHGTAECPVVVPPVTILFHSGTIVMKTPMTTTMPTTIQGGRFELNGDGPAIEVRSQCAGAERSGPAKEGE